MFREGVEGTHYSGNNNGVDDGFDIFFGEIGNRSQGDDAV